MLQIMKHRVIVIIRFVFTLMVLYLSLEAFLQICFPNTPWSFEAKALLRGGILLVAALGGIFALLQRNSRIGVPLMMLWPFDVTVASAVFVLLGPDAPPPVYARLDVISALIVLVVCGVTLHCFFARARPLASSQRILP